MQFLTTLLILCAFLASAASKKLPQNDLFKSDKPRLTPPSQPGMYCRNTRPFIQFGSLCTLGSHFNLDGDVRLWAYDLGCDIIGEIPSVPVGKDFGFNSQLPSVVVINRLEKETPPVFWYEGKQFGGRNFECWRDGLGWFACAQQFQC